MIYTTRTTFTSGPDIQPDCEIKRFAGFPGGEVDQFAEAIKDYDAFVKGAEIYKSHGYHGKTTLSSTHGVIWTSEF